MKPGCAAVNHNLTIPIDLQLTHLPQLSPSHGPAQTLAMTCFNGSLVLGSLQVVQLKLNVSYNKWRMVGADRSYISRKQMSGWSVLAAPPTGSTVQRAEQ